MIQLGVAEMMKGVSIDASSANALFVKEMNAILIAKIAASALSFAGHVQVRQQPILLS